jgi:hypothetical protein
MADRRGHQLRAVGRGFGGSVHSWQARGAELSGLDIRAEQRYYTRVQVLLVVPLLIALLAAAQCSRRQAD